MELVYILVGLIAFDLAAHLWGKDSNDGVNSAEWDRRRNWQGFGHN